MSMFGASGMHFFKQNKKTARAPDEKQTKCQNSTHVWTVPSGITSWVIYGHLTLIDIGSHQEEGRSSITPALKMGRT